MLDPCGNAAGEACQLEKDADIQIKGPVKMALGKFFNRAMDPSRRAMDQPRKLRRSLPEQLIQLLQTSCVGQIGAAERDVQTFCCGESLQLIGGLLVTEIIRDDEGTCPREA